MDGEKKVREFIPEVEPSTVLVVDDDENTRSVISFTLQKFEHHIVEAEDGQTALDRCRETLPDLIITDIMMPNMDGNEFVEQFRQEFMEHYVPILMVTARTEVEDKVKGLGIGADDYLTKPFNYQELQARVQAHLRIKVLTEDLYRRTKELEGLNAELSRMQDELIKKERQLVAMQLAGAAAHNLGQPITSILLNCRILEQSIREDENSLSAVKSIQSECEAIRDTLSKLKGVDSSQTQAYLDDMTILDLDGSDGTGGE